MYQPPSLTGYSTPYTPQHIPNYNIPFSEAAPPIELTDQSLSQFTPSRTFNHNDRINSTCFSRDGHRLYTGCDDNTITVYNVDQGSIHYNLPLHRYGVDHVTATHANDCVLHSCTKGADDVRYISLHTNRYIRTFSGHTKKITGISMSPNDDFFMTTSLDKTLRYWDVRVPNPVAKLTMPARIVGGFDNEGFIFAVGTNNDTLHLFDVKNLVNPFSGYKYRKESIFDWVNLKFSPDGKTILVSTNGTQLLSFDSFSGHPTQILTGHVNVKGVPLDASFTPDSKYIFCGSSDGSLNVWNFRSGRHKAYKNQHTGEVKTVKCHPSRALIVSSCTKTNFWTYV